MCVYIYIHLYFYLSIYLSIRRSIHISIYVSIHVYTHLPCADSTSSNSASENRSPPRLSSMKSRSAHASELPKERPNKARASEASPSKTEKETDGFPVWMWIKQHRIHGRFTCIGNTSTHAQGTDPRVALGFTLQKRVRPRLRTSQREARQSKCFGGVAWRKKKRNESGWTCHVRRRDLTLNLLYNATDETLNRNTLKYLTKTNCSGSFVAAGHLWRCLRCVPPVHIYDTHKHTTKKGSPTPRSFQARGPIEQELQRRRLFKKKRKTEQIWLKVLCSY